jgi:hypothetical protein
MDERSATLRRAIEALNSICLKPSERPASEPEDELPAPANDLPTGPDPRDSVKREEAEEIPSDDPAEWREPFARWLASACVCDPRGCGGVSCLHLDFCEWAIEQKDVPCKRLTFECLLRESRFVIDEVAGVALASGLIFRDDFEAAGL